MSANERKIVVVDDEYDIVELVKAVLRTKGYRVIPAYDGEEGYKLTVQERPDMVIMDLRMPKMSGMELCKRIRANPDIADTPVLIMSSITAGSDKPDEYWAAGLHSDDFMPKPFDPLSLLGRVEYLLRKHQYISTAATRDASPRADSGPAERVDRDDPSEVVRTFVESWNRQDFNSEFSALGEEMLGGVSKDEYIKRRMTLYQDEGGEAIEHRVLDTDVRVSQNVATVACLREDMVRGAPRRKDERYTLKRTPQGWKIVAVRSRPITFTLE